MRTLVNLLRLKQWIKNIFVLAPLIFSLNLWNTSLLLRSLIALGSFCLASSFVYILNDIIDREKDRQHPDKRKRPLASGQVSVGVALSIGGTALLISILGAAMLDVFALAIVLGYVGLNIAYSLWIKKVVIADVVSISLGFLLRIAAGGISIDVEISLWLILTTFFLSLFLGFGKRRCELTDIDGGEEHRPVLAQYGKQFLDYLLVSTVTLTLITYSLYVADQRTIAKLGTSRLIYTIPIVVFALFRYLYLVIQKKQGGDPGELILKDRAIAVSILLWGLGMLVILYSGQIEAWFR